MKVQLKKVFSLPVLILLVCLFLMVCVSPVSADDGQPQAPTPEPQLIAPAPVETEAPPEQVIATPEVVETGTPEVVSPTPVPEEPAPTNEPTGENLPEIVDALSENDIALAEPSGRSTSMGSISASSVSGGDPYYTVGTVTYRFAADCTGLSNCTASATPIQAALTSMAVNGTPTDRKLYIEADTDEYVEGPILINGGTAGVSGLLALVGLGAHPENVNINGAIAIGQLSSGFTIQNLKIHNSTSNSAAIWVEEVAGNVNLIDVIAQSTGTDGSGICVTNTTANLTLNRVESSGNGYHGLFVQNNSGNVTITNSAFDKNNQDVDNGYDFYDGSTPTARPVSVLIDAAKNVTINGISASENPGGVGLNVFVPGFAVTVKNSIFNYNLLSAIDMHDVKIIANTITLDTIEETDTQKHGGIWAMANNSFSGRNIWVDGNKTDGLIIDTCQDNNDDGICETTGPGTVTITNGFSSNNNGHGVDIQSKGAITIKDFNAVENSLFGFRLNNSYPTLPMAVTLTNISALENGSDGVNIISNGTITIKNIIASDNTTIGLKIDHSSVTPITITNDASIFNMINNNGMGGFNINSHGPITIFNIQANNNSFFEGGKIDNSGATTAVPVTIGVILATGDTSLNEFIINADTNLSITSRGLVTLTNVMAYQSGGGAGLIIDNTAGTAGVVIKKTTNAGNYFDVNHDDGVRINTNGPVTVDIGSARTNGGDGVDIHSKATVSIIIGSVSYNTGNGIVVAAEEGNGAVTITGKPGAVLDNGFLGGIGSNILVTAKGNITLTNINGTQSDLFGANLNNSTGTGNVSITNGYFDGNNTGLQVTTNGTITWSSGSAVGNILDGAKLYNYSSSTPKAVAVIGVVSENNGGYGFEIITRGSVTVKTTIAEENDDIGIYITNSDGSGTITLADVRSDENGDEGMEITGRGAVTLINVTLEDNSSDGITITTTGAVTFTNVNSTSNGGEGAFVTTPGAFTIIKPVSGYNDFSGNGSNGLHVTVGGKVTLARVAASYGVGEDADSNLIPSTGVLIDNTNGSIVYPVVITDLIASNNPSDGLSINSYGPITLTKIVANNNGQFGVHTVNTPTGLAYYPTVTLTDITTNANGWDGLFVDALGNIVAGKLQASGNVNNGIVLTNVSGNGTVTITNTKGQNYARNNGEDGDDLTEETGIGIWIQTTGVVSVTGVEVSGNDGDGLIVNNSSATSAKAVTLSKIIAKNNRNVDYVANPTGAGINVNSKGLVTINSSWSSGNTNDGIHITTTANIVMSNTASIGNDYSGIFAVMPATNTVRLTNCAWFGNLLDDPNLGDRNLMVGGILTIL